MSDNRVKHISLIMAFIAAICSAGLSQLIFDLVNGKTPQAAQLIMQKPTKANLRTFERDLQDNCRLESPGAKPSRHRSHGRSDQMCRAGKGS